MDTTRMPVYLGQTVTAIPVPVLIRHVKATNVNLDNTERKPDSTNAKVRHQQGHTGGEEHYQSSHQIPV